MKHQGIERIYGMLIVNFEIKFTSVYCSNNYLELSFIQSSW